MDVVDGHQGTNSVKSMRERERDCLLRKGTRSTGENHGHSFIHSREQRTGVETEFSRQRGALVQNERDPVQRSDFRDY